MIKSLQPGQKYPTRNGGSATVVSIDEPGLRPVCARVDAPGQALQLRYFTADDHEWADWRDRPAGKAASPWDFLAPAGPAAPAV
jgi:hypothetical protein